MVSDYTFFMHKRESSMGFATKIKLFISMLVVGILYGLSYHMLVMPMIISQVAHCILGGLVFAGANYFIAMIAYRKYIFIKEANKLLNADIKLDKLTGLFNRRSFEDDILEVDKNDVYSLIFIDIDNFREFNNKFGHQVGDMVLQKVSQNISSNVRNVDNVYRYGGEEIVVLLKGCDKENALRIAEKIRLKVGMLDNSPYPCITLSLGVASYPGDGASINDVIEASDNAMLTAKRRGKNCTFVYCQSQAYQ